jgi:triosephosphate isomerase
MSGTRRGPVVAANWKMHLTRPEARALAERVVAALTAPGKIRVVLIPPFTALADVGGLREVGCSHVLVGHSERRRLFGETDEAVNRKVRAALNSGLSPIVCVGETLEEREGGRTTERIDAQLAAGLRALSGREMERIILAYEPVWAIGTGKTASPAQAEDVHAHIRKRLEEAYGNDRAFCAIILYGGSVKPANSYPLFKEKNIDGFLVGGASLDADAFAGIMGEVLRADREET